MSAVSPNHVTITALCSSFHAATTCALEPARVPIFQFEQTGAENSGRFVEFDVNLMFGEESAGADGQLQCGRERGQEMDRDASRRCAAFFYAHKSPTAHFIATKLGAWLPAAMRCRKARDPGALRATSACALHLHTSSENDKAARHHEA